MNEIENKRKKFLQIMRIANDKYLIFNLNMEDKDNLLVYSLDYPNTKQ